MISFLGLWLCTVTLASGGIFHQALAGGEHTALHFQVLGAHVVAFVAFAVYWMILYPRYFTPFGNIPTPSRRRILTGNYPVLFPDNAWVPLRELAETTPNDGLLRIYSALSGEALLVTSPPAIRDMLTVNAFDFTHQDLVKIAIRRFTGSNLGFLSNDEFKAFPHVGKLTSIFWAKAQEMVRCMSNELRADSFARIDFREYMSRATLNNIGLAGMGHDFQTLKQPDTDLRSHHRKLILDPTRVFSWVGLLSRYFDMRLLMRVPLKKLIEISQSAKYLRELTTAVIQGRREQLVVAENNRGKDIITVALAGGVFDEHHLVDHVMTFLTAGHESTATAFEWTMYELGRRPEMQSRLRDELRATIGTDLAAVNFGLRVQNLPYLNAFCSEVLRCYPFSPIIVKVAQKETMLIGQRIPKGTVVLYSAEVSNHDKTLWGPDADKFDPERWMGAKKAKSGGASSNYAMLTFGAGPRNCIGANFARATLECLVAAVLSTFEIELANPDTAGRLKFGQTKKSAEGIYGRLKAAMNLWKFSVGLLAAVKSVWTRGSPFAALTALWPTNEEGKFIIQSEGIRLAFTNHGAALTNLWLNNTHGEEVDVLLGLDDARVILHISNSITFVLFDNRWNGFPGIFASCVTHTVTPYEWRIAFGVTPLLKAGPINFSQQVFFNLDGFRGNASTSDASDSTVLNHRPRLPSSGMRFDVDEWGIPTGDMKSNREGKEFDFWSADKFIGDEVQKGNAGSDVTYVLSHKPLGDKEDEPVAILSSKPSGVTMELYTDQDALHVHTWNSDLAGLRLKKGQGQGKVAQHAAISLEMQDWPDAVHHPEWRHRETIWGMDGLYTRFATYKFSVERR
ncbi:hypothetical protein KXV78_006670 [Aspergillus fumigatus]|nr:hypothetical protein KXX56_004848 [Aspergillus fumigatus]KAH2365839.1 hypothetical protein KXV62_005810 [Aspergillus fumigatus]KAH2644526.1 hypothetical protein KXW90_005272 [Aspergillus fumigatus]KAH3342019.1 hypothetical protein KXW44_004995 [Aspergillus fumigatus]KAH3455378.1 hypothetical protein KXV78_006670 [Aspergillus fumigatus]